RVAKGKNLPLNARAQPVRTCRQFVGDKGALACDIGKASVRGEPFRFAEQHHPPERAAAVVRLRLAKCAKRACVGGIVAGRSSGQTLRRVLFEIHPTMKKIQAKTGGVELGPEAILILLAADVGKRRELVTTGRVEQVDRRKSGPGLR